MLPVGEEVVLPVGEEVVLPVREEYVLPISVPSHSGGDHQRARE